MLGLNVKLKETRFYQEIAEEESREGGSQILICMLNKRFGPLPQWVQQKFDQADIAQLQKWSEQILTANSLDDVFKA